MINNKFFRFLTNKFVITSAAFVVWMIFFDENNWSAQRQRQQQLKSTEENIAYLQQEITSAEKRYKALTSDAKTLERFAREKYRMKRDNEDVYVVERK